MYNNVYNMQFIKINKKNIYLKLKLKITWDFNL